MSLSGGAVSPALPGSARTPARRQARPSGVSMESHDDEDWPAGTDDGLVAIPSSDEEDDGESPMAPTGHCLLSLHLRSDSIENGLHLRYRLLLH